MNHFPKEFQEQPHEIQKTIVELGLHSWSLINQNNPHLINLLVEKYKKNAEVKESIELKNNDLLLKMEEKDLSLKKMKVALFISGRINRYKEHLIKCINDLSIDNTIEIDLFISLNGERDDYCIEAEQTLKPWLKDIQYEVYKKPEGAIYERHYYNVLSCFYNDSKAYNMIINYSAKNNIQYDYICKFRPDFSFVEPFNFRFPPRVNNVNVLYSCTAIPIYFYGNINFPMLSVDFVFGSPETMKHYCNTYDFIQKKLIERNGDYRTWYEPCVTESFYNTTTDKDTPEECKIKLTKILEELPIKIEYFSCNYELNPNRTTR